MVSDKINECVVLELSWMAGMLQGKRCDVVRFNAWNTSQCHYNMCFALHARLLTFAFRSKYLVFPSLYLVLMFVFDFEIPTMRALVHSDCVLSLYDSVLFCSASESFHSISFRSIFFWLAELECLHSAHLGGSVSNRYQLLFISCRNKLVADSNALQLCKCARMHECKLLVLPFLDKTKCVSKNHSKNNASKILYAIFQWT